MNRAWKIFACCVVVAVVAVGAFVVWRCWPRPPAKHGPAGLSPWAEEAVPRLVLAAETIYLQADPQWAHEKIGGSGEELRAVGCTNCCLCMALAQHGIALNPAELNQKLIQADGYTERGWIKWDTLRDISQKRVHIDIPENPSHRDINGALAAGNPVLVKIVYRPGVLHWVLLVGREGREYLIKDPLGDGKSLGLLSAYHSDILSVRIVAKL
ncbi:MAG: cysteine peptidase family C39 domain-containing protein [Chthoniobacter sp.]|uniref:cysteine peptidase family C39 domain-containing protein n=1 Tax=Chthoniobacter sp. TaxID=2510640 RepID=UPI0032ACE192